MGIAAYQRCGCDNSTDFDRYLIQHVHKLNESVDQVSTAIDRTVLETLPPLVIQCLRGANFHVQWVDTIS